MVDVSIVVPVYNSEKTIEKTINALLSQKTRKNYEIIVVDDGSTDSTPKILARYKKQGIKVIRQKNKGPAAARNTGWKNAKAKIVAFIDSDCRPVSNWLEAMAKPFSDKNVGAVGGTYRTENKYSLLARYVGLDIEMRHSRFKREIEGTGSFSIAFKKNLLKKTGGFDETYRKPTAEDFDLCFSIRKLGKKIMFAPGAIVYHYHPEKFFRFLKEQFRHARARTYMYNKFKSRIKGESYTPLSTLITIPLSFLFIISSPLLFFKKLFFFPLAIFLILILLTLPFFFYALKKKDFSVAFASIPIQLSRFFAWAFGMIAGATDIITGRRGKF